MMKWLFKWLFRLFLLAVVLVVILLLSLNSILRVVIENRIHAQTGMDAEIGSFRSASLNRRWRFKISGSSIRRTSAARRS